MSAAQGDGERLVMRRSGVGRSAATVPRGRSIENTSDTTSLHSSQQSETRPLLCDVLSACTGGPVRPPRCRLPAGLWSSRYLHQRERCVGLAPPWPVDALRYNTSVIIGGVVGGVHRRSRGVAARAAGVREERAAARGGETRGVRAAARVSPLQCGSGVRGVAGVASAGGTQSVAGALPAGRGRVRARGDRPRGAGRPSTVREGSAECARQAGGVGGGLR